MFCKGKGVMRLVLFLVLVSVVILSLTACGSSRSSSSSSYTYGTRESYDSKYGKGSYDADKALLDSMRDAYNSAAGK